MQIRQEILDRALLDAIREVLDERLIDAAVARALERLRASQASHLDRRRELERAFSVVEARIGHLTDAVAQERATDVLLEALETEANRKRAISRELEELSDLGRVTSLDDQRLVKSLRARAGDVQTLLGRHVSQGGACCAPSSSGGSSAHRSSKTGTAATRSVRWARTRGSSRPSSVTTTGVSPWGYEPVSGH